MFNVVDHATAAVNILGAIDALENALTRAQSAGDVTLLPHESELLNLGIIAARFVTTDATLPLPGILSVLVLQVATRQQLAPRRHFDARRTAPD